MSRIPVLTLSLLLSIALPASAQTQKRGKTHKSKPKVVQPEPAPTTTPVPEPPPTPEKGPASPPEVSFEGGQLTIVARNSTMGDVLNAVKQKTGAAVEMPVISSERVVGRFGPGAPRDVMAQLLNGSHYDYVLVGSPADPGALKKVVLMARASGPEPTPAPAQQPGGSQPPGFQGNQNLQAIPEVDNEQNPEENSGEVPSEEPQQQGEEVQPDLQGQQNGPVVKTPEQLLRELQQQQQQQQQQQDIPPGAPGQPPQ